MRDGHAVIADLPAVQALGLLTTAFTDIGYIPVLRRRADGIADDGVLTGTLRAPFMGVPGDGRQVRLNVHLRAVLLPAGLLGDMDLEVAALRYQLQGGESVAAMADSMVAEVRQRTTSAVSLLGTVEVEPAPSRAPAPTGDAGPRGHPGACGGGHRRVDQDRGSRPEPRSTHPPPTPSPLPPVPARRCHQEHLRRHRRPAPPRPSPRTPASRAPPQLPRLSRRSCRCPRHLPSRPEPRWSSPLTSSSGSTPLNSARRPSSAGGPRPPHHRRTPNRNHPDQRLHRQPRLIRPWRAALAAAGYGSRASPPTHAGPAHQSAWHHKASGKPTPSPTTPPPRARPSTDGSRLSFPRRVSRDKPPAVPAVPAVPGGRDRGPPDPSRPVRTAAAPRGRRDEPDGWHADRQHGSGR